MCKQPINLDGHDAAIKAAHADIQVLNDSRKISQEQLHIPMVAPVVCLTERRNKDRHDSVLQRLLLAAKNLKW